MDARWKEIEMEMGEGRKREMKRKLAVRWKKICKGKRERRKVGIKRERRRNIKEKIDKGKDKGRKM